MKIKTLLIDPDARSRKIFRHLVEEFVGEMEILGEADSVHEALQLVNGIKPQLLVVDAKSEREGRPQLEDWNDSYPFDLAIMASYHELPKLDYAAQSVETLSKPVTVEDIRHLARKLGTKASAATSSGTDAFLVPDLAQIGNQNSKIALPMPKGFKIVTLNEILFCSADRVYTDFVIRSGQQLTASRSLKYFEELLTPFGFLRVHSSFLVNLDHIQEYIRGSSGKGGILVLTEGQQIPVARGRKMELLDKFAIR